MLRCMELATMGAGKVSPNPMVGCVIVHKDRIIGEGWHQHFGEAHAEVNAILSVKDVSLFASSTLYVNLEPCSHFGKTPPCVDLILEKKIPKVVIGMVDPNPKVSGSGIQKLVDAGVDVKVGVMQHECKELNKRFICYVEKHRPYIILKWAQSKDGLIAPDANKMNTIEFEEKRHITGFMVQRLVHKWRTEEDAIMVGTNTVISDNPALNARAWFGRNPVRIGIDLHKRIPENLKIFDQSQPTILFVGKDLMVDNAVNNIEYIGLSVNENIPIQVVKALYARSIQSLIIEGGEYTLSQFIQSGLWDVAQVFVTPKYLTEGVKAPVIDGEIIQRTKIDNSTLTIFRNPETHAV